MYDLDFKSSDWDKCVQEQNLESQDSKKEKKLTLRWSLPIDGCYSFDFLNETTLVATSQKDDRLYKFTRTDE